MHNRPPNSQSPHLVFPFCVTVLQEYCKNTARRLQKLSKMSPTCLQNYCKNTARSHLALKPYSPLLK